MLINGYLLPNLPWSELGTLSAHSTLSLPLKTALDKYAVALKLKDGEYHFPNLCGIDQESNEAATLRGAGFQDWELCTCAQLAVRNSLFGASVVPAALRNVYDDMHTSFRRAGIEVESNGVFVEDLFSYRKAFAQLARGMKIMPYQQSIEFSKLVREHGLLLVGPSHRGLVATTWARNKTNFRNFVAQHSPHLIPYPRVCLERGRGAGTETGRIVRCLEYSLSYLRRNATVCNGNLHKFLFVQLTQGAGGLGNFIVSIKDADPSKHDWSLQKFEVLNPDKTTTALQGFQGLLSWFDEKLKENSLEVAPFLNIIYSFSIAAVVDKNSVVCMGRTQQLNDQNSYLGYLWPKLQAQDSQFMSHYARALDFQYQFSAYLRSEEFYRTDGGPLTHGVDFAVVMLPNGKEALIAVECNCRAQAPQATEMLALNLFSWRNLIEENELVLLGMDHLSCPGITSARQLKSELMAQDFPLSGVNQPYGLLPIVVNDGQAIALFTGRDENHAAYLLDRYREIMA